MAVLNSVTYNISCKNPGTSFIQFKVRFELNAGQDKFIFKLPNWRPGRYELAGFAKNIRGLKCVAKNGMLDFEKKEASVWEVFLDGNESFEVVYEYYAAQYDAGSTWVDLSQLYLNPVNCFIYSDNCKPGNIVVNIKVPDDYIFATSLVEGENKSQLIPVDFDELFDSPIVASNQIRHASYRINNTPFHIWFIGECSPDWKKIITDFNAFTNEAMKAFGSFPFDEFHFLIHILSEKAYHGVEHLKSTVITLGPGYELMEKEGYDRLLGISSHELYHAWNVKTIRPAAMVPYDYQKENYTSMGYLTEGVTSYMGDLLLLQSGVFSKKKYLINLENYLVRHTTNDGRYYYSVMESSMDTWLDGYSLGIPNRKTSIYVEGALLSFLLDMMIMEATDFEKSLHHLMKDLYEDFGQKGVGVTNDNFVSLADKYTKGRFSIELWPKYNSPSDLTEEVSQYLSLLGLELKFQDSSLTQNKLGIQFYPDTSKLLRVAKDSPAEHAGLSFDDELISVNHLPANNNALQWIEYFEGKVEVEVKKKGGVVRTSLLPDTKKRFFPVYSILEKSKPSKKEQLAFQKYKSGIDPFEEDAKVE